MPVYELEVARRSDGLEKRMRISAPNTHVAKYQASRAGYLVKSIVDAAQSQKPAPDPQESYEETIRAYEAQHLVVSDTPPMAVPAEIGSGWVLLALAGWAVIFLSPVGCVLSIADEKGGFDWMIGCVQFLTGVGLVLLTLLRMLINELRAQRAITSPPGSPPSPQES